MDALRQLILTGLLTDPQRLCRILTAIAKKPQADERAGQLFSDLLARLSAIDPKNVVSVAVSVQHMTANGAHMTCAVAGSLAELTVSLFELMNPVDEDAARTEMAELLRRVRL